MKTQTIEVEGLPEGWKSIRYGWPKKNVEYVFDGVGVKLFLGKEDHAMLIVKKIQPRRIVLEETSEKYLGNQVLNIDGTHVSIMTARKWREVKESDIPLNSAEPKLSLSVDECKELYKIVEDAGFFCIKIHKFIEDK